MFKTYKLVDKVFCYHIRVNTTTNTIDSVEKKTHNYCEKQDLPAELKEAAIKILIQKALIFEGVEY